MVVLETIGYYRWQWSGSDAKNLLGGSLIATWSGNADQRRSGLGFMIHLPKNYSLGLVQERYNNQTSLALTLSIDLGKLFQDPAAQKSALLHLFQ